MMASNSNQLVLRNNGTIDIEKEGERLLTCLDEVEKRVERLREQTVAIREEKESLLKVLHHVNENAILPELPEDQQEDILSYSHRLACRCLTVEVSIITPRDPNQEKALTSVNKLINDLDNNLRENLALAQKTLLSYVNACSSEQVNGQVDAKFQSLLLECTVDDQKSIKHKLKEWLENLKKAGVYK